MKKIIYLYIFFLIFIIGCSNNLPQQVIEKNNTIIENKTILPNITIIQNKTTEIQNITNKTISNQSNETILPKNIYKLYLNDKINYDYKTIILQNINPDGQITLSVDNITWTIYQTREFNIINGLEIQTLEINLKENYVILEIKPFILKQNRYLFYKGNTLSIDNITNITLININTDNSIILRVLNRIELIDNFKITQGDFIQVSNLTITNIKTYPRELGYENHAIIKIDKKI